MVANYYPFLYYNSDKKLVQLCIEASIMNNYFLHFAGSSFESRMIDNFKNKFFLDKKFILGLILTLKNLKQNLRFFH